MEDAEIKALMQKIVPSLKHCKVLGITVVEVNKGKLILSLAYSKDIIGNPDSGVIHGGALTTLMDTACGFAAVSALDEFAITPTLDLRIDYMGAAKPGKVVLGEAEVYRVSENIIFARGMAYHEGERQRPIAHCTATFMRLDPQHVSINSTLEAV